MANQKHLEPRLFSAVSYVRLGASIADIGTDHAYLPIYLLREGIASGALACDIGAGPISCACENISAAGLSDRISTLQTDGLHGVERFSPDHILIFGMGGELIVKILSEAPWVCDPAIRLILQPMSRAEVVRKYLWENGFRIVGETLSQEDDRIYQTLCAEWCGKTEPFDPIDCLVGKREQLASAPLSLAFLKQKIRIARQIIAGKSRSKSPDLVAEREILQTLETRLLELGGTI